MQLCPCEEALCSFASEYLLGERDADLWPESVYTRSAPPTGHAPLPLPEHLAVAPIIRDRTTLPRQVRKVRGLIVIHDDSIASMNKRQESQAQERFGERVRELRKEKGLSQEALALASDLDRTYIGGVERGERNISLINIYKIAGALGVTVRELF